MESLASFGKFKKFIRIVIFVLVPLIFLPLPLVAGTKESRCGYVILVMIMYWTMEPIPIAVTSLIPVALFPLLSVLDSNKASSAYLNSTNMLFIGGLIMAVAIEKSKLHHKIALRVLMISGSSPHMIMLSFMTSSMILSMWISNTATAALMVPIVQSLLDEMERQKKNSMPGNNSKTPEDFVKQLPNNGEIKLNKLISTVAKSDSAILQREQMDDATCDEKALDDFKTFRTGMYLAIAYACNIGGTGTLIGTGPNLALMGYVEELFPKSSALTFFNWMLYNTPVMIILVLITWIYLYLIYARRILKYQKKENAQYNEFFRSKYRDLGPFTFEQIAVAVLFFILVVLWVTREPDFVPGWASLFPEDIKVSDASAAILVCILLFIIPRKPSNPNFDPILDWKTTQSKLPWGIILLLGSGFSISAASKESGLSRWAGQVFANIHTSKSISLMILLSVITCFLTQFASNVAVANIMIPVVAELSISTQIHPFYYMIPVTIACSFSFMLPVGTPPNAIVFEASGMKTWDMLKAGIGLTFITILFEIAMLITLGNAIYDFSKFPEWAHSHNRTILLTAANCSLA